MKKLILLGLMVVYLPNFAFANHLMAAPKVDKRVELLSIVFRLAGNQEYSQTPFTKYSDEVDRYFSAFKDHELIKFAKTLKDNSGISYDAVVSMAVVLDENLDPMIDFSNKLPEQRWTVEDAGKFINLLKKFNKDAECERFFLQNEGLFQEVSNRFDSVYKAVDLNWFQSFYGSSADDNFNIIISPGCGINNYGPSYARPDAKKEVFAIMGTWKVDDSGMAVFKQEEYLPTIIHEFSHSFVNPLLARNEHLFEESGKSIYSAVEYEMSRQQAYGRWQIMLNEAMVRAAVINYFIDHGTEEPEVKKMLQNEYNRGFIWIEGLVDELKKYKDQRSLYPTMESYMPLLSEAYLKFAESINRFEAQRPIVESLSEFTNNELSVNPELKTITINFDRPLDGKGYSINIGEKGKSAFPKVNNIFYTNDNKSVVMEVQLEPDTEYQFVLTGKAFKTDQGNPLKLYEVNFKTQ